MDGHGAPGRHLPARNDRPAAAASGTIRRHAPHREYGGVSRKEYPGGSHAGNFSTAPTSLHCAGKLKGGDIVHIVIAQMIVTGVLLIGFSADVLLSHFASAK